MGPGKTGRSARIGVWVSRDLRGFDAFPGPPDLPGNPGQRVVQNGVAASAAYLLNRRVVHRRLHQPSNRSARDGPRLDAGASCPDRAL